MNKEIKSKVCTKCKEEKALEDFSKRKRSKDGRMYQCKECKRAASKAYYEANREAKLAKGKEWYESNKETRLAKCKEYYEANREAKLAKQKVYRDNNRDRITEKKKAYYEANKEVRLAKGKEWYEANKDRKLTKNKEWRETNKQKMAGYQKAYRKYNKDKVSKYRCDWRKKRYSEDPIFRTKMALRNQTKRLGNYKSKTTIEIVGISAEEFWRRNGSPTEEQLQDLHVDHIIPLSWFDLSNEDHVAVSSHHSNLQYLSSEDNMAKGSSYAGAPDSIIAYKDNFDIEAYVTDMLPLINIL